MRKGVLGHVGTGLLVVLSKGELPERIYKLSRVECNQLPACTLFIECHFSDSQDGIGMANARFTRIDELHGDFRCYPFCFEAFPF